MPNFVTKRPMFAATPRQPQKENRPALKQRELAPRANVKVPLNEEGLRKQLSQLKTGLGELSRLKNKPAIERHFVTSLTHPNPTTSDPKLMAQLAIKQATEKVKSPVEKPGSPLPYAPQVNPVRLQEKHYPSPAAMKLLAGSHKGSPVVHPVTTRRTSDTAVLKPAEQAQKGSEKEKSLPQVFKSEDRNLKGPAGTQRKDKPALKAAQERAKQLVPYDDAKQSRRTPLGSSPAVARPARANFNVPVRDGADKEAFKQIMETRDLNKAHHLPSAARLAQVVQAHTVFQKENGKAHPELAGMVQKIQSGQRRAVADIPAEHIEKIMHDALGGRHNASQKINTPEVARMVDRHSTMVNAYQSERNEREVHRRSDTNVIRGEKQNKQNKQNPSAPVSAVSMAPSGAVLSSPSHAHSESRHSAQHIQNNLMDMLANNEEAHLGAVMANDRGSPQQTDRVLKQSQAPAQKTTAGTLATAQGHEKPAPNLPSSARLADREGPSPHGGAAAKAIGAAVADSGSKSGKQTLEGTLRIAGTNGQPLGQASLSGELK